MAEVKTEFDVTTGGTKTVVNNAVSSIELKRKPDSMARGIGKAFGLLIGVTGIFISCILFVTIIGILPGVGLFFMSLGVLYAAQGKQQVACPNCKRKQHVLKTAENFTCPKCRQLTVINWK